jgi:hypothetical protein
MVLAACCWPSVGGRAASSVCGSFCGLLAGLDAPGLASGASLRCWPSGGCPALSCGLLLAFGRRSGCFFRLRLVLRAAGGS